MEDKNGWIDKGTADLISNTAVGEGIRTGGCSQTTGDWIEVIDGL